MIENVNWYVTQVDNDKLWWKGMMFFFSCVVQIGWRRKK